MATNLDHKRRLRACRRLAVSYPDRTASERLEKIAGIAAGEIDPGVSRPGSSPDMQERLERGMRSRAKGNALDRIKREEDAETERRDARIKKEKDEKRRQERATRDRNQASGYDRRMTGS